MGQKEMIDRNEDVSISAEVMALVDKIMELEFRTAPTYDHLIYETYNYYAYDRETGRFEEVTW